VHDETGRPIKDAEVILLIPSDHNGRIRPSMWDYPVKTDAEGKWRCDLMPEKLDDVWIRLKHRDYISDNMYGMTPKPSMEQLRTMTGIMVMKKGVTVAGTVMNASGKPIEGALVAQGSDRFGSHYPTAKTDVMGRFQFNQCTRGEMVLT